jgi:hypothetical protein
MVIKEPDERTKLKRSKYAPFVWSVVVRMEDKTVMTSHEFAVLCNKEIEQGLLEPQGKMFYSRIVVRGAYNWFTKTKQGKYMFHVYEKMLPKITEDLIEDMVVRNKLPAKYQRVDTETL